MALTPQSTGDLLSQSQREYILLAGKDGAGKSCAVVSIAAWVQAVLNPEATFYVIDTENKFPTALRSFGSDAPTNIVYFKTETMNEVNEAADYVLEKRKAWDWLAVESMARIWERAQDMGYQAVSGYGKVQYLEKRREMAAKATGKQNVPVVIPKPDEFWNVVKGAHDSAFMDQITQASTLNLVLSTTVSRPPKPGGFIKENDTRKEARLEFGLDAGLDGAPRLPTYVETTCLLDLQGGKVVCRVLRDNISSNADTRPEFLVDSKAGWATAFWTNCR